MNLAPSPSTSPASSTIASDAIDLFPRNPIAAKPFNPAEMIASKIESLTEQLKVFEEKLKVGRLRRHDPLQDVRGKDTLTGSYTQQSSGDLT
ncbi:hypothetical protein L2E82_45320 [Cichorium intybus]|uniref:Uncharacterized protein n=1 Tax=Cichorium intybus TaxID=13427 RepID=A0ACB8ZTZ7_CICIN|nr:hypothetical protein L2E82_45320 [Cichorium intybus]